MSTVKTGLDRLREASFAQLKGLSVGLLTHPAAVDQRLRSALSLFSAADLKLEVVFGPEHGLDGAAQDMEVVEVEAPSGPRVVSLYGHTEDTLRPTPAMMDGLNVVVVDLQDVGARYYTYAATMGYLIETAAQTHTKVLVLDRPNPIGGLEDDIEGPTIDSGFHSFVGAYPMPVRHGLTLGEYALYLQDLLSLDLELEVLKMEGWRRVMAFDETGLPWVQPSPNMPTLEAAWLYPGQCLLEGTNLSEGRGTTKPFELCGAPWLDGKAWAEHAQPEVGEGLILRPTTFKPMFQKFGGQRCGGLQVHAVERSKVRSLQMTLALLRSAMSLAGDSFAWRTDAYEYISDRLAIDLLFGSTRPRTMLESGASVSDILRSFEDDISQFAERRRAYLLYES